MTQNAMVYVRTLVLDYTIDAMMHLGAENAFQLTS